MFKTFRNILGLTGQIARNCESQLQSSNDIIGRLKLRDPVRPQRILCFHTSRPRMKDEDEISKRKSTKEASSKSLIVDHWHLHESEQSLKRYEEYFPKADLPYKLFDGIPFIDIPVLHIKATRNNTILDLFHKGQVQVIRSCGCDGFRNTRKGTNIAAQTTGLSFAQRALKKGFKTVRVVLRGFGPGRISAMRGLEQGGMKIISITDNTVDASFLRPRKQRRL